MSRNLTDEDVDAIANALASRISTDGRCPFDCRFDKGEAETVHTLHKYVPSKYLPTLGKALKVMDDFSYELGKWLFRILFIAAFGGFLVWVYLKVK